MVIVPVASVTALIAGHKYTEVFTAAGPVGLTSQSIVSLLADHPGEWVRCSRNAAVRISAARETLPTLDRYTVGEMVVDGVAQPVPVSRRRTAAVHRELLSAAARWQR